MLSNLIAFVVDDFLNLVDFLMESGAKREIEKVIARDPLPLMVGSFC